MPEVMRNTIQGAPNGALLLACPWWLLPSSCRKRALLFFPFIGSATTSSYNLPCFTITTQMTIAKQACYCSCDVKPNSQVHDA